MEKIKKILINDNKTYFYRSGDLHTHKGSISSKEMNKKIAKSNTGEVFHVLTPNFIDKIRKIKRGPAVVLPKDIGAILTYTGINKNSIILEAGTGTGYLASYLSQFVKKVVTYEKEEKWFKLSKENFSFLEIKNIKQKHKDILKGIDEKNIDLIVLDMPEPEKVLVHAKKALKHGSFLVAYLPSINQVQQLILNSKDFLLIRVIELIERNWIIKENIVRPENIGLLHTAFLVFLRKV